MSALFGIVLSTSAPAAAHRQPPAEISINHWQPAKGDRFLVDTEANIGYLVHKNGSYARVLVATGRRQTVHYIGRTYDATTPVGNWVVRSIQTNGDRITFGPEGHFLRMYQNGDEYTSYGIHDYAYIDKVFLEDTEGRYYSMGCILVRKFVLDLLEKTYALNGDALEVVTTYGIDERLLAKH